MRLRMNAGQYVQVDVRVGLTGLQATISIESHDGRRIRDAFPCVRAAA
jgi:hypothetical protein